MSTFIQGVLWAACLASGCGTLISFLLSLAGWNQLMLECPGECGMMRQAMNQGQAGFCSEEPEVGSWWPERELGMAFAREGY